MASVDEQTVIPSDNDKNDCVDETQKLRRQLAETEEKLVKFKKFSLSLRNERDQLNEKVANAEKEIDKLKQEAKKNQNKNYQQIFTNFQNLQAEYDKQQDIIEEGKKKNKVFEQDLVKCGEELSNCKNQIAQQIEELHQAKTQSQAKDQQIQALQITKQELESKIIVLQQETKEDKKLANEVQNSQIEEYEKRINILQESNENLQRQLSEKISELRHHSETEQKYSILQEQYDKLRSNETFIDERYNNTLEQLSSAKSELNELQEKYSALNVKHSKKCIELNNTITEYEKKLRQAHDDIEQSNIKFEQYKTKVSNVLKEGKFNSSENDHEIEELRFENDRLKHEIDELRIKFNKASNELSSSRKQCLELQQKRNALEEHLEQFDLIKTRLNESTLENVRLNSLVEQGNLNALKEKETIESNYNIKINELKHKYETQIEQLEQDLHNSQHRHPSPVCVNPSSPSHISDTESVNNSVIHSFVEINGREDVSQQSSNNSNSERNFLEDILNNDSDNQSIDLISASEIDNLTQMLGDSENNIQLLTEQNRLLKDEIRRLTKNIERMDIADNLEYLKNVLLKFMTIHKVDERERLITVLTTILKLTNDERRVFADAILNGQNTAGNSKWSLW